MILFDPKPTSQPKFSFPLECIYLKLNGSWPTTKQATSKRIFSIAYHTWAWYVLFAVALTIYFQSAFLVLTLGDVMKVTENCCTTFMGVMNFIRLLHLRFHQTKFRKLLGKFVEEIWIERDTHPKIEKQCNNELKIIRVMALMNLLLIVMYITLPLVQLCLNPAKHKDVKPFPYEMIFFYDAHHGIRYILTYIFTSHAGWCVVTTLLAEDSLFGFFVTYACGQFRILHQDVCDLIPQGHNDVVRKFDGIRRSTVQEAYRRRLHGIARRHETLLRFCKSLDDLMSPILLANFSISSILICMVGFQIVTGKTMFIGDYVKFLLYIFALMTQLLVLCWNGDRLIQISTRTSFVLYSCNWEGGTIKHKNSKYEGISYHPGGSKFNKELAFMMARSHKSAHVTALKFSIVSLQSFTKILSTSMSYFALLQTFIEDK